MGLWELIFNRFRTPAQVDDSAFEDLLSGRNVGRALSLMTDSAKRVQEAIKIYDINSHSVMERRDKAVFGKKNAYGVREFVRFEKKWKIPIPYPVYINEIALVFLYGRPVKWSQLSEGTDDAFSAFNEWMERARFNAKIRQAKRLAGAETQSAMIFHTFQNEEGKADLLIKVVAKSLGDELYFRKDSYDRLTAFARGYYLTESGGNAVHHIDFFMKDRIYECRRGNGGWDVEEKENLVGKIPVILFEQETEFDGVEPMIERREWMTSVQADVNDRFSSPTLVAVGDRVLSLPDKMEDSKSIHIKPSEDGRQADVKYLTWNEASESKKQEREDLDRQILNKSFTPEISFEQMRGLSNISGKALKQLMLLAVIKAEKRKETHDEYASRIGSLMRSIIGNVLDIRLKSGMEKLRLGHEFQEPFPEDIEGVLKRLIESYSSGGMSLDTFVEQNPLIRDAELEKKRIEEQRARELEYEARRFAVN
jgi:SPP1 family phage portal protein